MTCEDALAIVMVKVPAAVTRAERLAVLNHLDQCHACYARTKEIALRYVDRMGPAAVMALEEAIALGVTDREDPEYLEARLKSLRTRKTS